ncbi:type VII secretion protein EccE [Plantactinospora sonchi]|uniref:Type VII secretion protein EccE n=1 Tax=Plantactinospora sonchi TaxID=1544735 RepID=A0ABU7RXW8_9ACTN
MSVAAGPTPGGVSRRLAGFRSPAAGSGRPSPFHQEPGAGGLPGVGRILTWQLALLVVVTVGVPAGAPTVALLLTAGLLVAVSTVRVGGRYPHRWAATLLRHRRRRGTPAEPAPTAVHGLLPRLLVQTQVDRAGNRVGVAAVGADAGHVAVVQLAPAGEADPATLVAALHRAFDDPDHPISEARLVVWVAPGGPVPIRVHWLALRYRYADAPWAALARGGGATGARRAAASAAQRLAGDLTGAGHPGTVLDTPDLYHALSLAIGADATPGHGGGYHAVEHWRDWTIGGSRQVCFVPRSAADRIPLLGRYVPEASFTCTSYALRRGWDGRTTATATARAVLSPGGSLSARQASAALGVRLSAADGRHGDGVLATLPLA